MPKHAMKQIDEWSLLTGVQIPWVRPVTGNAIVFVNIGFGTVCRIERFDSTGCHPVRDKERSERNDGRRNVTCQRPPAINYYGQKKRQNSQQVSAAKNPNAMKTRPCTA